MGWSHDDVMAGGMVLGKTVSQIFSSFSPVHEELFLFKVHVI